MEFSANEIVKIANLVERKKFLVNQTQDNLNSLYEAAKNMYNDDSAFILELIQNADDSEAKEIVIKLTKDSFSFEHNGNVFTLDDIEQITKADAKQNKKRNNKNKIGEFGIGFKSVFKVTNKPLIHSGRYKFEIENYIVPKFIIPDITSKEEKNIIYEEIRNTIISFKFDSLKYNSIKNKLLSLKGRDILFLNNVKNIQIFIDTDEYNISKENLDLELIFLNKKINFNNDFSFVHVGEEYFLIANYNKLGESGLILSDKKNKNIKIAFQMKKDNKGNFCFVKCKNSNFNVFFPTNTPTGLNFLIQGRYTIGMNRIELNNSKQNFLEDKNNVDILKDTSELLKEVINKLVELELADDNFLDIIINKEDADNENIRKIRKIFNEGIKEYFLKNKKYKLSKETDNLDQIIFINEKEISDIFNANDIYKECYWLDEKYIKFYDFFVNILEFKTINIEWIKKNIDNNKKLIDKSKLENLYYYLMKKHKNEIDSIRFIETSNGTYETINNKYLYIKNNVSNLDYIKEEFKKLNIEYNPLFIKETVVENEKIKNILEDEDRLKELSFDILLEFIKNKFFIEKESEIKNITRYFDGFNLVLRLLKYSDTKKIELNSIGVLSKNISEDGYLINRQEGMYYIENEKLKNLYIKSKAIESYKFIDNSVYEENILEDLKEEFKYFISISKVKDNFYDLEEKRCSTLKFYSEDEQKKFDVLPKRVKNLDEYIIYNPKLEYDEEILKYIEKAGTEDDTKIFLNLVLLFVEECQKNHALKGWYKYCYTVWQYPIFLEKTDFVAKIRKFKWIKMGNEKLSLNQISLSDIEKIDSELYKKICLNEEFCDYIGISRDKFSNNLNSILKLINNLKAEELKIVCRKIEERQKDIN